METTETELTAYEKRMLQLAETQTDYLEVLKYLGIAAVVVLLVGVVLTAIAAFS